jgi:hypothetical protein
VPSIDESRAIVIISNLFSGEKKRDERLVQSRSGQFGSSIWLSTKGRQQPNDELVEAWPCGIISQDDCNNDAENLSLASPASLVLHVLTKASGEKSISRRSTAPKKP